MILMTVSSSIPSIFEAQPGVNPRTTFRRSMENRLRPRLNARVQRIRSVTKYPKLADQFYVEQETGEALVSFRLGNRHPAYRYMIEGSVPHVIIQRPHIIPIQRLINFYNNYWVARTVQAAVARRGVEIHHPGIEPDENVLSELADAREEYMDVVHDAIEYWAVRWGTQEAPYA